MNGDNAVAARYGRGDNGAKTFAQEEGLIVHAVVVEVQRTNHPSKVNAQGADARAIVAAWHSIGGAGDHVGHARHGIGHANTVCDPAKSRGAENRVTSGNGIGPARDDIGRRERALAAEAISVMGRKASGDSAARKAVGDAANHIGRRQAIGDADQHVGEMHVGAADDLIGEAINLIGHATNDVGEARFAIRVWGAAQQVQAKKVAVKSSPAAVLLTLHHDGAERGRACYPWQMKRRGRFGHYRTARGAEQTIDVHAGDLDDIERGRLDRRDQAQRAEQCYTTFHIY